VTDAHFDVIVIGTGPGGGSLAQRLAPTGKRILVLERGDYLPREAANWDTAAVFNEGRYQADETWFDQSGRAFVPMLHYVVGGNSKVYGAALVRLRRADFGALHHRDGVSPAWPIGYDAFDPYYLEAERLFHVHGLRGEDPSEPNDLAPFPYPRVEHEPRIASLSESLTQQGLKPFHLPLGVLLDQKPGTGEPTHASACIRCAAFDGFPCLTNGKADSQIVCIDPMVKFHPNVTLLTNAYVTTLDTDAAGRTIKGVNVTRHGATERYSADVVVVACGSLNSALLLLRSANAAHPNGLANGSDQVGRNYMRHNQSVMLAVSRVPNDTVFQKTLALSDFYFGTKDWPYPMGFIQMCGKLHAANLRGEIPPRLGRFISTPRLEGIARHTLDFWLSSEDLPDPDNRVTLGGDGAVRLALTPNNMEAHVQLSRQLKAVMDATNTNGAFWDRSVYVSKAIPIEGVSHQVGTLRFGTDPRTSVLDTDCKAHEIDNMYVTDGSFFPSSAAVNPTLTIIANALRVADHLKDRLGA
jgi:choline dehydrogenase-like flavoprotein